MQRLKSFLLLAGMVLSVTALTTASAVASSVTMDEALVMAAKDGRPILIDFWRDG